jgi:hypothetical protein
LASEGYERQNTNFNAAAAGHINIGLLNMDTSGEPKIARGSVIEVNGGLYAVSAVTDESVTGTLSSGAENYIYAVPQVNACVFQYSAAAPAWSAAKGGWYNGNERAVAKLFYWAGSYYNKVILNTYHSIKELNPAAGIPDFGGTLFKAADSNLPQTIMLGPGLYRWELKGGNGGKGGAGGAGAGGSFPGGAGATGESKNGGFIFTESHPVKLTCGVDGGNGADGGGGGGGSDPDGGGGGGGGAGGTDSVISTANFEYTALGGAGGGGGSGQKGGTAIDDQGGGGGGGGQGYGQGGAGTSGNGYTPAQGGNSSGGGAEGEGYTVQTDGVYIRDFRGGAGGTSSTDAKKGGGGISGTQGRGAGGGKKGGGGGGKGGGSAAGGGNGGSLKSTSSGYARLYRVG